ncbi:hypothetical protein AB685_10735 [Bacillus sp. LL01]|nr:hypothetical protein AB685_10735 [Bacillus sp. LL01]
MYKEKKNLNNLDQWLNHQETKESLFEENIEIIEIIHLGTDIYRVKDEDGKIFLVEFKQQRLNVRIHVYNEGKVMERFGFK